MALLSYSILRSGMPFDKTIKQVRINLTSFISCMQILVVYMKLLCMLLMFYTISHCRGMFGAAT